MKHSTQLLRVLVIVHVWCCPAVIVPETIFITVNVAVVGVDVGEGVVLFAAADC